MKYKRVYNNARAIHAHYCTRYSIFPRGRNDLLNDFNGHKDDTFNRTEWPDRTSQIPRRRLVVNYVRGPYYYITNYNEPR